MGGGERVGPKARGKDCPRGPGMAHGNGDVMTAQSASYGAEAHQVRGFEAKPHLSPVADSPGKD